MCANLYWSIYGEDWRKKEMVVMNQPKIKKRIKLEKPKLKPYKIKKYK